MKINALQNNSVKWNTIPLLCCKKSQVRKVFLVAYSSLVAMVMNNELSHKITTNASYKTLLSTIT